MIRKALLLGGGATLLGALLFGRDALSYIRTSAGYVTDSIQESVPIEFQIDRARGMIQDLVPEVRKNMHIIAKEETEVQRLEEQIAESEARQAKEKEHLLRLKSDLATGSETFQYASRNYSAAEVRTDLANRFERFKTNDATLASLKEIRAARRRAWRRPGRSWKACWPRNASCRLRWRAWRPACRPSPPPRPPATTSSTTAGWGA